MNVAQTLIKIVMIFFLFKSNERSEDSHIGLADFFFRKQSLKCA